MGVSAYHRRVALGWFPYRRCLIAGLLLTLAFPAIGQIDPEKRQLIQLGYNYHVVGQAPLNAYGFYYLNQPNFIRTNLTLRLAVAPVYMDGELGISGIGPNTDLGIGFAGGGFAESYFEVRRGGWIKGESFDGHGVGAGLSLYHLFNPASRIPLSLVLRATPHYTFYEDEDETSRSFVLPRDQWTYRFRGGLRWGGREPLLNPRLAMEVSAWYEGVRRSEPGSYGIGDDRQMQEWVHNFWARALLIYTIPDWEHQFEIDLSGGTSLDADRFSAYRLGGFLPLAEEFALPVPGYYFQEISARSYGYFSVAYQVPIDSANRWQWKIFGASAVLDYVPGLELDDKFISGVGTGIGYNAPSGSWQAMVLYGYGIQAARPEDFAGHSLGFLLQFDLERRRHPGTQPSVNPYSSRGLLRLFQP